MSKYLSMVLECMMLSEQFDSIGTVCGMQRSDLERFTDSLGNLLADANGRRLFRDFLRTREFKEDERILNLYEMIETGRLTDFGSDVVEGIEAAVQQVDEIGAGLTDTLNTAHRLGHKHDITEALFAIQTEAVGLLQLRHDTFVAAIRTKLQKP